MKKVLMSVLCCSLFVCSFIVNDKAQAKSGSIVGLYQFVSGWNRNFNPFLRQLESAKGFVYEPLVIYNGMTNEEIPWLAESVLLEDDLQTIIIKVRKGIKWSDGVEFTADDVEFNFNYLKDHPEIDFGGLWSDGGQLKSVQKIDDFTVEVVLNNKNAFGKSTLFNEFFLIAKHIWENVEEPTKKVVENPVGTGALTEVIKFTPQLFVMGRNPYYWKADELKIDKFFWPQFNSNDAAYDMLQSGKVDWAHIFIPEIESVYVAGDENKKYWFPSHDGVRITMNMMTENKDNLKAFKDINFRRAFSLAMNRKDMMNIGAYGYVKGGNPATGLPPLLWSWRNPEADKVWSEYYTFDLNKAKQILADAGYKDIDHDGYLENPDGTKIKFDIQVPSGWTDWVNNTQIAVEGLRKVGINANVATPEANAYIENWGTGNFDSQFCSNNLMPTIYKFYDFTMSSSYFHTNNWWSAAQTNYPNEERDALISELKITGDKEKQRDIVDKIEMMYANEIPQIPLYYNGKWFTYNTSRLTGWANEDNPYIDPSLADHDNKIIHLLHLRPVAE